MDGRDAEDIMALHRLERCRNGEFMATKATKTNDAIVLSALSARSNFYRLLRRIDAERRPFVIERRGAPAAVLLSILDYVKLAAPEPEILKIIGKEAKEAGKSELTARQIDQVIKAARTA
jgi:PHD/YefM family antitoxin component YafN of YafNO toxin-antitoxin module